CSRRCRSLAISARMRSRSGLCGTGTPACASRSTDTSVCATKRLTPRIVTQRMLGRLLLRLLLRRSLTTGELIADPDFDDEPFVVIGTDFVDHAVLGELQALP